MSAYRVTLLDCDICGAVLDLGPQAVGRSYRDVRRLGMFEGWRSWRNHDFCSTHDALTMHQALSAADSRFAALSTSSPEEGEQLSISRRCRWDEHEACETVAEGSSAPGTCECPCHTDPEAGE